MKSFLLFIIANIIFFVLAPIGFIWQAIRSLFTMDKYLLILSKSIDQTGNVVCSHMFNDIFIKKQGHKFGNEDETISSVLGKNYQLNTLTYLGKLLSYILNKIDKNHIQKSIGQ